MGIIACTALHEDKYKKKCFDVGMNSFLAKPIMIKELKEMLQCF